MLIVNTTAVFAKKKKRGGGDELLKYQFTELTVKTQEKNTSHYHQPLSLVTEGGSLHCTEHHVRHSQVLQIWKVLFATLERKNIIMAQIWKMAGPVFCTVHMAKQVPYRNKMVNCSIPTACSVSFKVSPTGVYSSILNQKLPLLNYNAKIGAGEQVEDGFHLRMFFTGCLVSRRDCKPL